ncbi:MAG: hypothetical protein AAFX08_07630 [Pseudomonadota bacterium]
MAKGERQLNPTEREARQVQRPDWPVQSAYASSASGGRNGASRNLPVGQGETSAAVVNGVSVALLIREVRVRRVWRSCGDAPDIISRLAAFVGAVERARGAPALSRCDGDCRGGIGFTEYQMLRALAASLDRDPLGAERAIRRLAPAIDPQRLIERAVDVASCLRDGGVRRLDLGGLAFG